MSVGGRLKEGEKKSMRGAPSVAVALLIAGTAWAQGPPPEADSARSGQRLEEVVVTAQRRTESAQRAAVPISVLTPDELRDAAVAKPQELTELVPALQVAATAAPISVYYLRGAGNFTGNALTDSAVAFNVGGVYIGRPHSTAGFFYDLERIEILKGPQGTLYGRNATGGAINVLPRGPDLGSGGAEVSAEYGNEDYLRVDGVLNVPLGPSAALRTAAFHASHDGYMNDGLDDQDDNAGRVSLLLEPTDELSIQVTTDYFDQGGGGPSPTPIALDPDNRFGISSPQSDAFLQTQPNALAGRGFNPIPHTQHLDNQFWGIGATIDWSTDVGTFTLLPAYRESRLDTVGTGVGVTVTTLEDDRQTSVEARFASDLSRRFDYIVGAYYFDEVNDIPLFVPNTQYTMTVQKYDTGVESAAAFGQLKYDWTDSMRATLGARYTHEEKFFEGSFEPTVRACLPRPTALCPDAARIPVTQLTPVVVVPEGEFQTPFVPTEPPDGTSQRGFRLLADETESFSNWTWRAALDWDLTEQNFLYASLETGFKSGGFFFSSDSQVFQPEHLKAYTLGSKNRLLDDRLQLDVEAFHWRYDDQQISTITQDSRGVTNLGTRNVGDATMNGVEVETDWLVTDATRLTLGAQYLDAVYDEFSYVTPPSAGPPLSGCAVSPGEDGFHVDCSGKRAPYAPEWTVNLGAEHTFLLHNGARIVAGARAHYQSETLTGVDFTPLEYQDGYVSLGASITYGSSNDQYYLTAFGNNLTDETVVANTFQPPFGSFVVGNLRPPRLYGVRLGAHF
jgi:iron complex outermembrane receptor protein